MLNRLRLNEIEFHKILELKRIIKDHSLQSTIKNYAENRFEESNKNDGILRELVSLEKSQSRTEARLKF